MSILKSSEDFPEHTSKLVLHFESSQKNHQHLLKVYSKMNGNPRVRREPASLAPQMAAMISSILGIGKIYSLNRHKHLWHRTAYNLVVWLLCLFLLQLQTPRETLAFCLAIGYTAWNLLPGSFTSLDLPSHSNFMRGLRVQDKQAECMFCWDELPLVQLPCKHQACVQCLQPMGENCQTTCPMCRRPLFNAMDWLLFAAMKSAFVSWSTAVPLCFMDACHELSHGQYRHGAIWAHTGVCIDA